MHVDTTWKFREMIEFRDQLRPQGTRARADRAHQRGGRRSTGINPFEHGSQKSHRRHEDARRCKQALDKYEFDAAFGGARRDEEKSRAKERIFSFRDRHHRWDPKNQRPELWNLYNGRSPQGREHPRLPAVELDRARRLAVHPPREDPDRAALLRRRAAGRRARRHADHGRRRSHAAGAGRSARRCETVRFRTLGLLPAHRRGRVRRATTLPEIIQEMLLARTSERQGRVDRPRRGAQPMEKKKREGYF